MLQRSTEEFILTRRLERESNEYSKEIKSSDQVPTIAPIFTVMVCEPGLDSLILRDVDDTVTVVPFAIRWQQPGVVPTS